MVLRKEIRALPQNELVALRNALIEFQANFSPKGYHAIAGYHGIPKGLCHQAHVNPNLFLAWHRYYVYFLENELRKIDSTISIPYWDWTDARWFGAPVAPAHLDPVFTDGTVLRDNPLHAALVFDKTRKTRRNSRQLTPRNLEHVTNAVVNIAYRSQSFTDFSRKLLGPHSSIHSWVGGDFAGDEQAAYDPLFWSHHAAVDRQWAIFQTINPQAAIPTDTTTLNTPLPGFEGISVKDVIDYGRLGYNYDNLVAVPKSPEAPVMLTIRNVHTTVKPYTIEVVLFSANSDQKITATSFGIFASGEHHPGHSAHAPVLFDEFLDITEAVKNLGGPKEDLQVEFVVKDEQGKIIKQPVFQYSELEIS